MINVEQKQEQQVQQIRKAYAEVKADNKEGSKKIFSEIKVDGIDYAYVWARTFVPSWLMGVIFLAGLGVMIPIILKKTLGIEVNFNIIKKKKEAQ